MKNALLIVGYPFPYGTAGSGRMLSFAKLFKVIGYNVHVIAITGDVSTDVGKTYKIDDVEYEICNNGRLSTIDSFFINKNFKKTVTNYIYNHSIDVAFLSSLNESFCYFAKILKNKKISFMVEQCEWMDISSYKLGYLDPRYHRVSYLRRKGYKEASGIVSISRLLNNHYNRIGVKSIIIPTILDFNKLCYHEHKLGGKIKFIFAGTLGKSKENLLPIIEAIQSPELIDKVELDIYGPSKSDVQENIGSKFLLDKLNNVHCFKKIPQKEMSDVFSKYDFLIFNRPNRRSSNAGFPTKLAEAMSVGTPVIANDTGDISLYLKTNVNGLLIESNFVDSLIEFIEKLDNEIYIKMRKNAYNCAFKNFNISSYENLKTFIEGI